MTNQDSRAADPRDDRARGRHVTLVRPPAISSRFTYTIGVVLPLGPAYVAGALLQAGHRVAVVDALGEAPLERGPTSQPDLIYHGLSHSRRSSSASIPRTDAIGISVMFSQQWPHVEELIRAIHARFPGPPDLHRRRARRRRVGVRARRPVPRSRPARSARAKRRWSSSSSTSPAGARSPTSPASPAASTAAPSGPRRASASATSTRSRVRPGTSFRSRTTIDGGFTYGVNLGRSMPILATRGCPYQCTFCSSPAMWTTRYYVRDVADVVDEIASYVERYRVTNVDFYDLTAIIKRDWILAFCAELERRGLAHHLSAADRHALRGARRGGARGALPHRLPQHLLRAGVGLGADARAHQEEGEARADGRLDPCRQPRPGIVVKANLMIGFPDETRGELWETVRFGMKLAWLGVEDLPLFPFIPYPGTELYDELRAAGRAPADEQRVLRAARLRRPRQRAVASRHVSSRQLAWVRFVGMVAFLLVGYLRVGPGGSCARSARSSPSAASRSSSCGWSRRSDGC